ncbi:RraA family protein [Sphingosinicella microcystinivorans]|uniref:Putative 4-hydroxy-4-methyl-2-oxoglutarate aldolase n=1 Tax=Sphingosinicella microcystinivorans TaxID=335406 RepID=A0AAD1D4K4_SPHMI|nr:RraA family protein [Sphingosinicella microcystinivorans]RKS85438.1 regulator of RNase E activity RraA [Sphingosinicella microcystinivorans]BBE33272.1 hypothetical protein SmB9_09300 [Sphingosinicella microcystinivorans]
MDALLALLARTSTSVMSDALQKCGIDGQCRGIGPINPGDRVHGVAVTARISPYNAASKHHAEYMDLLGPGSVPVLDGRGIREGALWGDLRATVAKRVGAHGTVVDGMVRDRDGCRELGYPVFARGAHMLSGNKLAWIEERDVPVTIGGVYVRPGDFVLGDGDGVLFIPRDAAAQVYDQAAPLQEADERMLAALRDGMSLVEARNVYGLKSILPPR